MRRVVAFAAVLLLVGCSDASGGSAPGTPAPGGIEVEVVASGFTHPWEIGFLPDGRMLVTERPGRLALVDRGTRTQVEADLGDVVARGEGGLMGLVVHPDFATTNRFTTCAATASDIRLVTWELTGNRATRVVDPLRGGLPVNPSGRHSGCRLALDHDGRLLVGTGDTARAPVAQDLGSLGGKVLGLDLATGEGGPITRGHRNVQGIAVREDGLVLTAEHGPDVDDELNVLQPGANYGWDPSRGGSVEGYDEGVPMTDLERFPDAVPAAWSSGSPTEAICDAVFLAGERWGDLAGALAVTALKGSKLLLFTVTAEGGVHSVSIPEQLDGAHGRLRGAALGPDQALYLTTSNGSDDKVLRVTRG
ncbi:PQQ-dependent sugar dehydrogenase [Saccharothrix algeriensis]|uniref:Glucose/arabinose dehydrogenase n=1 Tax=Saccharothrix algeriensis TaxID=173560 RepID=A0A8T8I4M1_9PSEU|nr:PQQ-dependent sugar dehydrogenase [Saccharothrix algeriensis]MBM7811534.1 glucose/arabinose dehydrogenase [Saccharothrix algeriensis]QTR05350.1 PQQ-dependent sugar dehydrogenase [Saccharothrix algeriensis]